MLTQSVASSRRISAAPKRRSPIECHSQRDAAPVGGSRRSALLSGALVGWAITGFTPSALAAKIPKGYTIVQDKTDGYQYLAPFGWQEVEVSGLDSVYKAPLTPPLELTELLQDLIEPLESVSVTLIPTEKASIAEFGPLDEVAYTLADKVLTPPDQRVKILSTAERSIEGTQYYSFEFECRADNYRRHALGVIAVGNGNFYALTTGSSERRWKRLEERLRTIIKSFQVVEPVVT